MDLLSTSDKRPKVFDLFKAGNIERFDAQRLGLKVNRDTNSRAYKKILRKGKKGKRSIYYTERMGHLNTGHEFGFYRRLTLDNKKDLIEYLKTL